MSPETTPDRQSVGIEMKPDRGKNLSQSNPFNFQIKIYMHARIDSLAVFDIENLKNLPAFGSSADSSYLGAKLPLDLVKNSINFQFSAWIRVGSAIVCRSPRSHWGSCISLFLCFNNFPTYSWEQYLSRIFDWVQLLFCYFPLFLSNENLTPFPRTACWIVFYLVQTFLRFVNSICRKYSNSQWEPTCFRFERV